MVEQVQKDLKMCEICENWVEKYDDDWKLQRAVFKCGHSLCVDCMKKYTASNVVLAYFPLRCPNNRCNGKIEAQQASHFIDKRLQLKLTNWIKRKIKNAEPELMSEYIVDNETLHHHPAIRISHYYWFQPPETNEEGGYIHEGFYKTGNRILFCLSCQLAYCARCKL